MLDAASAQALIGATNEECVQILFDSIPDANKWDSDRLAKHLSMLIGAWAFKLYPVRDISVQEQDRLLMMFVNRSAGLRLIRKEKKDADEFGEALDSLGIPREKAFTVLVDCKHVLEDEING